MVRSKNNSSSNKSLKNMHPSQFNNPRKNVNNLGGRTADKNMQNHNIMPNTMTQAIANISSQNHNMMQNSVTQNTANMNGQTLEMMINAMTQKTVNMNRQGHNTMPNAMTQLPQWQSQITMNDILNNYVGGPNSGNSLFTSGCDLCPQSNFHSKCDSNQVDNINGIYPLIDQSNYPLINEPDLSNNGPRDNIGSQYSKTVPVGRPYGKHSLFKKYDHYFSFKVMKTSNSDASEFKMRNQDFPALPGTQMQMLDIDDTPSPMTDSNQQWSTTNVESKLLNNLNMDQFIAHNSSKIHLNTDFLTNGSTVPKPGVQTSLDDGKVTNIPSSMLRDQFGIIGQLITMRTAEYDPELVALTFGQDLTSLGMNLNSPENIYPTFAGPFENSPLGPHNIEFDVPSEYKIHHKIKNKLAPIKFSEYKEDLLFYLFYTHFGDGIQMAVASELRTRGWRYHIEQHIWIYPVSGSNMSEIDGTFERGTFYVFDVLLWRKVPRELMLNYTMLDGCVANATFIPPSTSSR